jgi:hypothetical protein
VTRIPRARRSGEPVETKRADELTADDYGCIVQVPGNRGWLRAVESVGSGTWVCTTTGVAVYPNSAEFLLWGRAEAGEHPARRAPKVEPSAADNRAALFDFGGAA